MEVGATQFDQQETKNKTKTKVDPFQFELQELDKKLSEQPNISDEEKYAIWIPQKAETAKSQLAAIGSLTWASLALASEVYQTGRCDEGE